MKRIFLSLLLTAQIIGAQEEVSYNDALLIPSVNEFQEYTSLDKGKYLKQALKNEYWQKANVYLLYKRTTHKIGSKEYLTIPYHQIIKDLKTASSQGVLLAAFQGYRISSISTNKVGKFARSDVGYFSRKLMEYDICLGYIETAYGYTRQWYNNKHDFVSASKVMDASKKSCSNKKLPIWVQSYYNKFSIQYKIMSERIK